jgi:hypothetical protein
MTVLASFNLSELLEPALTSSMLNLQREGAKVMGLLMTADDYQSV